MSTSQIKVSYLLGESLCQCMDGIPTPFSVDSSMPSPSPALSGSLLFVLESTTEGGEGTEADVATILESAGKLSVSFTGSMLTVKDRSILVTPLVNVLVACVLFV